MGRILIALTIVTIAPFWLQAQMEIEVQYDPHNSTIIVLDKEGLQAGEKYRLKIRNVNSAYIFDHISIRSFRYVSPIPEILKPVLPGISGSDVYAHFGIRPAGQREFFLKSLRYFNELEIIRSASDDLYSKTRFGPNPELAKEKLNLIQSAFDSTDLQYISGQIMFYRDYILAAESIYKSNISKVTLMTPDADVVIREHARLSRIVEKINEIDYVRLLEFITLSTVSQDFILSEAFTAEKDVNEIRLALYDAYIQDTIYTGFLEFETEQIWSFDFSTGFFYSNLYEKDYFLARRTDEINDVLEENEFKGDLSVGALAHITYKINPRLRLGPSLGASISPFDGNIRYLLGFGAFVGNEKIVGLSAGISIGQMEVLSGAVTRDGFGYYLPEDVNRIPTFSKTRVGMFLGITYNFTRHKTP